MWRVVSENAKYWTPKNFIFFCWNFEIYHTFETAWNSKPWRLCVSKQHLWAITPASVLHPWHSSETNIICFLLEKLLTILFDHNVWHVQLGVIRLDIPTLICWQSGSMRLTPSFHFHWVLSISCYEPEGGGYIKNRLPFHCEMRKNQVGGHAR